MDTQGEHQVTMESERKFHRCKPRNSQGYKNLERARKDLPLEAL